MFLIRKEGLKRKYVMHNNMNNINLRCNKYCKSATNGKFS